MYTSLYRPKTVDEFVGNPSTVSALKDWLLHWNAANVKTKAALLSGPCGVGKSTLAELVCCQHGYHIVHLDLDQREFLKSALHIKCTCDGRPNALVVSDIDSISDHGFIPLLKECIKETEVPIVCICDDRWDQAIKSIVPYCMDLKLTKPSYTEVYRLMYQVATTERIRVREPDIQALYEQANGDIRFMLNTLQLRNNRNRFTKDIQSTNVFDTTSTLLSMDQTLDEKYQVYWRASELHPLMVQENYVNSTFNVREEARKLDNLAASSAALSSADIFLDSWDTGAYGAYSVIEATLTCNKKGILKFPQILGKLSVLNKNRREKKQWDSLSSLFDNEEKGKVEQRQPKKTKAKEPKAKEPKTKEPKAKKTKPEV